jgi:uncharacterized protein
MEDENHWVKYLEADLRTIKNINSSFNSASNLNDSQKELLEKVKHYAFQITRNDDVHGIGHIIRVIINIQKILENEQANVFITLFSGWLHDIGRIKEQELKIHHAIISAEMARKFVVSNNLNVSKQEIDHIIECIESHSFSAGREPRSIEAKILSDADKIDALGSIGIYRAACFQHENGKGIEDMVDHFHEKLLLLKDQIYTKTGLELALVRINFMVNYLVQLKKEYNLC